jgi:extracellular elastinolytic metalloproteinase
MVQNPDIRIASETNTDFVHQHLDQVILNTQDGSGTNNANFATPPDGQLPRMRMYIWTKSTPYRDSSFEAGVVIHEYT